LARPRVTHVEEAAGEDGGNYWTAPPSRFFSTGCVLLDCALGGGWALGRVANIIGDKSTGKTQLAIEACANFARTVPKGDIHYIDAEAAFDVSYAEVVGLPSGRVLFPGADSPIDTVEAFFEYVEKEVLEKSKETPLVILDSLDALSDKAEMDREISKGSYGQGKAKLMGQLFRRLNQRLAKLGACVLIISQARDNIDAAWGKKETRAGGRALDYYAAQFAWLYPRGKITREQGPVKRVVGIDVLAKIEKNKVGSPWREAKYPILFNYGIDDVVAGLEWLAEVEELGAFTDAKTPAAASRAFSKLSDEGYQVERERLAGVVRRIWAKIEGDFAPSRRKYSK